MNFVDNLNEFIFVMRYLEIKLSEQKFVLDGIGSPLELEIAFVEFCEISKVLCQ